MLNFGSCSCTWADGAGGARHSGCTVAIGCVRGLLEVVYAAARNGKVESGGGYVFGFAVLARNNRIENVC